MAVKAFIVEVDEIHEGELAEFAAARSGRIEPYALTTGKHGYLDRESDNQGLADAAAAALGISPDRRPAWSALPPKAQELLSEAGADSWSYMNEGRFEPEEAEALREALFDSAGQPRPGAHMPCG